jgi:hypothetical protein
LSFATTVVPSRSRYSASAIRALASVVLSDSQAVQFPGRPAVDAALVQEASAPARPPRSPLKIPFVMNTWVCGPVGGAVGVAVGEAVGDAVGDAVGEAVGSTVGEIVGEAVGSAVGVAAGVAVGVPVGVAVGVAVGPARAGVAVIKARLRARKIDPKIFVRSIFSLQICSPLTPGGPSQIHISSSDERLRLYHTLEAGEM